MFASRSWRKKENCSTLYIRLNKNFWNALPCISRASLPYPIWQLVTGLYKSLTSSVSRQCAKLQMVKLRTIYRVSRSADYFHSVSGTNLFAMEMSPKGRAWILVLQVFVLYIEGIIQKTQASDKFFQHTVRKKVRTWVITSGKTKAWEDLT